MNNPLLSIALFLLSLPTIMSAKEHLVYVSAFAGGEEGAIHAFSFDTESGALTPLKRTTDVENPFFMALSPDGEFLYTIHALKFGDDEDEEVAAYRIAGRDGTLELLNRQSSRGTASCYLDVDSTGKTVVVANYTSGSVASLPVNDDGSLGEPVSFFQHEGSSVDPKRQKEPHAHSIIVSPGDKFAYAADLGVDQVLGYKLDPAAARLEPAPQASAKTPAGAGPRHVTFHPDGKHLYAINELSNSVTRFDFDAETGELSPQETISTLPADFEGRSFCADLKITPDGQFLYGTNRGHDSIAMYRIAEEGKLSLIGIEPSLGKGPQNLAITPDGRFLLCANMPENNVVVFRIDPKNGTLQATGDSVTVPKPSCIMLLP